MAVTAMVRSRAARSTPPKPAARQRSTARTQLLARTQLPARTRRARPLPQAQSQAPALVRDSHSILGANKYCSNWNSKTAIMLQPPNNLKFDQARDKLRGQRRHCIAICIFPLNSSDLHLVHDSPSSCMLLPLPSLLAPFCLSRLSPQESTRQYEMAAGCMPRAATIQP